MFLLLEWIKCKDEIVLHDSVYKAYRIMLGASTNKQLKSTQWYVINLIIKKVHM